MEINSPPPFPVVCFPTKSESNLFVALTANTQTPATATKAYLSKVMSVHEEKPKAFGEKPGIIVFIVLSRQVIK